MEDEAEEKTVALKKAYAGIILNTAKEAARRVITSEQKALSFQQDLWSTKAEGLRMLVRLKRMLDSKIDEVAMTTTSQNGKVEELEAQLSEAEEIITDLRIELKSVQNELRKVKNNNIIITSKESCHDVRETVLGSTTMTHKDPEMLEKNCTQQIRAFEGNFKEEKLPPEDVDDHVEKGKSIIKEDEIGDGKVSIEGSPMTNQKNLARNKVELAGVMQLPNFTPGADKPVKVIRKLRRCRKPRIFSTESSHNRLIRPTQLSCTLSKAQPYSASANENKGMMRCSTGLEGKQQMKRSFSKDKGVRIRGGECRKRKLKHKGISTASPKSTPGQLTKAGQQSLPSCPAVSKSSGNLLETTDDEATKDLVDVMVLVKHESDIPTSRKAQICIIEDDKRALSLTDAKIIEETDGHSRVNDDKFLNYVFQRKRKKEFSSNSDENTSLGKSAA